MTDQMEFDFDNITFEEDNVNINLKGDSIATILGFNDDIKTHTQAVKHFEVDIDTYDDIFNASSVMQNSVQEGTKDLAVFDTLNKDMFLSLFKYKPEVIAESRMKKSTRINNKILKELVQTDDYKSLRKNCKLDIFNSAIGTEIIGDKAVGIIKDWRKKAEEELERRRQNGGTGGNGQPSNPFDSLAKLKQKEKELDDLLNQQQSAQEILDQMGNGNGGSNMQTAADQIAMDIKTAQEVATLLEKEVDDFLDENDDLVNDLAQMLTGAFSEADDEVCETSDFIDMWGIGDDDGGGRIPFNEKREAVERIRNSKKLKDLTNLIGRFKDSALQDQKRKTKDGATSIKSIKNGNKIESVLPSEKMKLCNSVTKQDFYRKYNQKELLQYELESTNKKSQGPLIICGDESGSMQGAREKWSKAVAIAMLEIAHVQKRDYAYIAFGNNANEPIIIEKGKVEPNKVLNIAEMFKNGGTSFEAPLKKALVLIKDSKFSKADIVLITDGESSISETFMKELKRIKEDKEFNIMGICINAGQGHVSIKTLETFCDKVIMLDKISDLGNADSDKAHEIFSGV